MPAKLLDKAAKSELRVMIGEILDGYCRDCEFYAYHAKTRSREEASTICHGQCSVGRKLKLLGEALEKGTIEEEVLKMSIQKPKLEPQQAEEMVQFKEEKRQKRLADEARRRGNRPTLTKEKLIEELSAGKNYEEIGKLYNLKASTVYSRASGWGLLKAFQQFNQSEASEPLSVITHPSHYTAGGIEVIDYIRAKLTPEQYQGYLRGNVIKYVSRYGLKGDGLGDLKKAQAYLNWLIEHVEGENNAANQG